MPGLLPSVVILGLVAIAAAYLAHSRQYPDSQVQQRVTASIKPLRSAPKAAFFAAWILALAATLNGIAHPLMAVSVGGYFPGLISSPFIGAAGIYLWKQLLRSSSSTSR